MNQQNLYRIKQFVHKHTWTSFASLANCIGKAETNGLQEYNAIIRDGKKVFIDENKFIEWVENCTNNLKKAYLHSVSKRTKE